MSSINLQDFKKQIVTLIDESQFEVVRNLGMANFNSGNREAAAFCFLALKQKNNADLSARFMWVRSTLTNNQVSYAAARDEFLDILKENPELLNQSSEFGDLIVRSAGHALIWTNQFDKAKELLELLCKRTGHADDYFLLKDVYSSLGDIDGELRARKESLRIDPEKYQTEENLNAINLAESALLKTKKTKIRRYPDLDKLTGDLQYLINSELLHLDFKKALKNINSPPVVYAMGGCWIRDFAAALKNRGINNFFVPVHEDINTCAGNLIFSEWLRNPENHYENDKMQNWFIEGPEAIKKKLKSSNIIFLTYTRVFELYDRITGKPHLGDFSLFSFRAAVDKYQFRYGEHDQNIRNIVCSIYNIKAINPDAIIMLQINPVPMFGSPENESPVAVDFFSKAALKTAIHEIITKWQIPGVLYWPSIEIHRWVGVHQSDFYGGDDGSPYHVKLDVTQQIMDAFISNLS